MRRIAHACAGWAILAGSLIVGLGIEWGHGRVWW